MKARSSRLFLCTAVIGALTGLLLSTEPMLTAQQQQNLEQPTTAPTTQARGRGGRGGRGITWPQGPEPGVHDPVMIKQGDWYYLFRTSGMINVMRSRDFKSWDRVPYKLGDREVFTVFADKPAWTNEIQPNRTDLWAPDIAFHNGKYFLYTCASTFGTNRSVIGLATNKTLDPSSPDFKWEDQGKIIESQLSDYYNCIDANVFFDKDGRGWLSFGSFYWNQGGGRGGAPANPEAATKGGMMLVEIDPNTGKILPGAQLKTIASRAFPERAIEAPFIMRSGNWYYLFVSWDRCCAGVRSTYRIMVGRSDKVIGPYLDKDGNDLALGGGSQVLAGDGDRIIGPGHQGLMEEGTPGTPDHRWLLLYHFYDGHQNGASKLQIRPVSFDTGWPVLADVLNKVPATQPAAAPRGQ